MFELIQAGENTFYFDVPVKVGLYRLNEQDVCLIDGGSDKDAGRRIRQQLDQHGWALRDIYCTHSHADHIGGCQYLQRQTGCRVWAPGIECDFTRHPVLEPMGLWGGYPTRDLRSKFLMAAESDAAPLTPEALPAGFEAIPLPGHAPEMTGFRTPDDVVFLADCLVSEETLEKYAISYLYDVEAYLATLERVKEMRAALFVPAHAPAAADIAPLAQRNIDRVREVAGRITDLCREPLTFEELLQRLFTAYGLTMTLQQYALLGSTLRSYLSWLKDGGQLAYRFEDCRMLWQTC